MKSTAQLPWEPARALGAFTLILVRHGQTEWNQQRRFLGITDIPLDDVGRAQAQTLSDRLALDPVQVYSSPLRRAHETALALHSEPILMAELQELHQGELEGMKVLEAVERYPEFFQGWTEDPGSVTPPGGEPLSGCQRRALQAMNRIRSGHQGGELAIAVSHQMVIATTLCAIAGSPLASWREFRLPNTGVAALTHDGENWSIAASRWAVEDLGNSGGSRLPNV